MSKYIDIEWLKKKKRFDSKQQRHIVRMTDIYSAPSIDIVRCRECIHCADDYIDVGMGTMPQFTCELGRCGESVQPNDFCSYGSRSEKPNNSERSSE